MLRWTFPHTGEIKWYRALLCLGWFGDSELRRSSFTVKRTTCVILLLGSGSLLVDWEANIKIISALELSTLRGMLLSVLFIEPDLPLLVPVEEVELAPCPLAEVGESSRRWLRMGFGPLTCWVTHIFYVTLFAGSASAQCSVFCCIRLSARSRAPQNPFLFQGLICPKAIWNASKFPATACKRELERCQQGDRRVQAMRTLNSLAWGLCSC